MGVAHPMAERSALSDPVFPSAVWLLRQLTTAPAGELTAAVVGPGGTGKSVLLRAVAAAYERAGSVPTWVHADTDLAAVPDTTPLLVDDAHELTETALDALRTRARTAGARMVVT